MSKMISTMIMISRIALILYHLVSMGIFISLGRIPFQKISNPGYDGIRKFSDTPLHST